MFPENLRKMIEEKIKLSAEYAKFYELPPEIEIQEITEKLLSSPYVKEAQKQLIRKYNRRTFVFIYPSDNLKIKALISFVPDPANHSLLVMLRGGNRILGIMNPGEDLMCAGQYTVITTTYRGGVSEGVDEFGVNDVNDVMNLIDYIPQLEKKINLRFQDNKKFLVGCSRGGMQAFLALARFPQLQTYFSKFVSLSGLLDMNLAISTRADMEKMFTDDFGLNKANKKEWIDQRDPILTVNRIDPKFPILIIQGTDDIQVSLEEGDHMVSKLRLAERDVTYMEINGGDHCLRNNPDRVRLMLNWIEEKG